VQSLQACLEKYSQAREFVWVQEEHQNWGAWTYMQDRFLRHFSRIPLHCVSREECPSSATGSFRQHQQEQTELVERAFAPLACRVSLNRARSGELE
jgi:2-oxoglutarate dehydrogenase E1 component